jgi:acetyltransferase-like isoleucine patch superfamily enzyme
MRKSAKRRLVSVIGLTRLMRCYRALGLDVPSQLLMLDYLKRGCVTIGVHTYGCPRVLGYGQPFRLEVGKYCSIADDVEILAAGLHRMDWVSTYPFRLRMCQESPEDEFPERTTVIGSDVWVGRGARILGGVRIGHGAVIGAYSVVTSDVGDYEIVAGCPARRIGQRFSEHYIKRLLEIAWWDWSDESVAAMADMLSSQDVARFVGRFANT